MSAFHPKADIALAGVLPFHALAHIVALIFAAIPQRLFEPRLVVAQIGKAHRRALDVDSLAAAVAAVYAAFVAIFIYKDMTIRECPKVIVEAGKLSVVLMFIIANAMLFAHVLTTEQIPQSITAWVVEQGFTPIEFLLVVNIVLLVAGTFMEPSAIILILAPILFPIAMQLGIDPIHLGIIMVVNMEIGLITPPTGLNLFVTSAVTGMPLTRVVRAVSPWLLVMLAFLVLVTYVPFVSLALPNWLGM